MTRRLFLFAGYDRQNIAGQSLLHYIRELSRCGDVVFVADSDLPEEELRKFETLTLHSQAVRHHEYDFGSYKRAWQWITSNGDIASYDYV